MPPAKSRNVLPSTSVRARPRRARRRPAPTAPWRSRRRFLARDPRARAGRGSRSGSRWTASPERTAPCIPCIPPLRTARRRDDREDGAAGSRAPRGGARHGAGPAAPLTPPPSARQSRAVGSQPAVAMADAPVRRRLRAPAPAQLRAPPTAGRPASRPRMAPPSTSRARRPAEDVVVEGAGPARSRVRSSLRSGVPGSPCGSSRWSPASQTDTGAPAGSRRIAIRPALRMSVASITTSPPRATRGGARLGRVGARHVGRPGRGVRVAPAGRQPATWRPRCSSSGSRRRPRGGSLAVHPKSSQ